MKKTSLFLVLLAIAAVLLSSCARAPRPSSEIVEELAVYYGTYGAEADEKVDELLKELSAADPAAGEKWKSIMSLWRSVSSPLPLNYGVLPDGLPDTDELCIVVLGFQLEPDGTMRNELIERLKVARDSALKYPNAVVVCTGGGTAAENESATEAGKMAEWLAANGVAQSRIVVEDRSLTTAQNAIFTYRILTERYPQVNRLAIVSSDYHIATGTLLFGAEATLQAEAAGRERMTVVSNAAWKAPAGVLSPMFQAGALIELSGDTETAFQIYYEEYDIHELPALD
ncbi:MAG: YdcF family protein [Oscillospiraceae bacterium]|nr:YdcF family protein [Oscillospiraceae bacterium]